MLFKIKYFFYRFWRWIVSFIPVLVIAFSFFLFPASAASTSILSSDSIFTADPFVTLENGDQVNGSSVSFLPSEDASSILGSVVGKPIGIDFRLSTKGETSYRSNFYTFNNGVLSFDFTFTTNHYFTCDAPNVTFGYWDDDVGSYKSFSVSFSDIGFKSSNVQISGSGSDKIWLVTCSIQIPFKFMLKPYFSDCYFTLVRPRAADTGIWNIVSKSFSANILTGSDVPKYNGSDIGTGNLEDAESDLQAKLPGPDDFSLHLIPDSIDIDLVNGVEFAGGFINDFINIDDTFTALITLLLGVGMCAFCINVVPGVVKSISHNSKKDTNGK